MNGEKLLGELDHALKVDADALTLPTKTKYRMVDVISGVPKIPGAAFEFGKGVYEFGKVIVPMIASERWTNWLAPWLQRTWRADKDVIDNS